jgi:hypothetical protein
MQQSYTLLILCIPIFFLASERQNLLRSRSCGHRNALFAVKLLARPENPTTGFFLKSPPNRERVSANAVTDRTLRRQSCARGCCCANAATRMPAVFACLLFAWSDHDIAQCSVLIEGRATVVTPALPWFHQRHRSRAARAPLFVRCSPLSSPHCASRYPCSQALSPAACCRFH